jgi:hypothetical protein
MRDIYLIGWNKNNPQRGAKNIAMEKTVQPKPRRGVKIIATDMTCASKPRRGARIIEMYMLHVPKPRRGVKIIESAIIGRQKPQRVAIIMEKPMFEHQNTTPPGFPFHTVICAIILSSLAGLKTESTHPWKTRISQRTNPKRVQRL